MHTVLEWLHWIRLIAHRHPNGPAWIQGVGSLLAVFVALVIFWRQGRAREKERQEDNRLRREQESKESRVKDIDRKVRTKALIIIVWPLMIQTRSRMAHVLRALKVPYKFLDETPTSDTYYQNYEIGVSQDWARVEQDIYLFGSQLSIAIHEMLAIIRQHDRDIDRLRKSNSNVDRSMHADFLWYAKTHADQAVDLLEVGYEKMMGVKPKRAVFWARSAKAAAAQGRKRNELRIGWDYTDAFDKKETESESPPKPFED